MAHVPAKAMQTPSISTRDAPKPRQATRTPSASDLVFFGITRALETQHLVPGQRLVEADLAAQFGVGRNSVREALHRLVADGIVDLSRHRGASIRMLSPKDVSDVFDVAELMTGLLTRNASRVAANREHKAMLTNAIAELASSHANDDAEAFGLARRSFYRELLNMSGSRELRRLFPTIKMPIVYAQFRVPNVQALRLTGYQEIGKAVLSGDPSAAEKAGRAHVRRIRAAIEKFIERSLKESITFSDTI